MAVGFEKPRFHYDYNLNQEKGNFERFFADPARGIPPKKKNEVDLATWNIANLGLQKRREKDLELIAYILSHFDIIAIQEVNVNLNHFFKIMKILKSDNFDMVITDMAGNQERLAVVYRADLLRPRQLFGEIDYNPRGQVINNQYVIPPKKQIFTFQGKKIETIFYNFNRNPFLSTWQVISRNTTFLLVNVHIYYGVDRTDSAEFKNRIAEVYYLANWAREQQKAKNTANLYESNIILIGDMNIPRMKSTDTVYRALRRRGMQPTTYSTEAGTTIQEFNTYDQIVFTDQKVKVAKIKKRSAVVVDFDNFIFQDLWAQTVEGVRTLAQFKAWTKFAISDHRPLFVRLSV